MESIIKKSDNSSRYISIFKTGVKRRVPPALIVISLVVLILNCVLSVAGNMDLEFLEWGGKCKIPKGGELMELRHSCDESRGIVCQKYSQGEFCGCPLTSQLTYDRRSRECRRRPGDHCLYHTNSSEILRYPRHVRCHEDAECLKVIVEKPNATKGSTPKETYQCRCRRGYLPTRDGMECLSINSAVNSSPSFLLTYFSIIVMITSYLKNVVL